MSNREVYISHSHSDLMFKKAMLDKFCQAKPVILMNQYDIRKISSVDVLNLLRTHQKIILDNTLHESSLYLTPDVIISEMESELNKYECLTLNEKKILLHIAGGFSSREIAKEMSISIKTVDKHRANIMKKLNIHKYGDLIKFARKVGIV